MSEYLWRGEQVALRPFAAADITDQYLGWLNDPRVTRFSNQRFRTHNRSSALDYLGTFANSSHRFLSIRRLADDAAIGTATAYHDVAHGTIDAGIMIGDPASWGSGWGQDSWNTLITELLADPAVRKLTAGCAAPNIGMIRLMERSDMTLEAVRQAQQVIDGLPVDIVHYARFASR